jgi:hypothetical protein
MDFLWFRLEKTDMAFAWIASEHSSLTFLWFLKDLRPPILLASPVLFAMVFNVPSGSRQ